MSEVVGKEVMLRIDIHKYTNYDTIMCDGYVRSTSNNGVTVFFPELKWELKLTNNQYIIARKKWKKYHDDNDANLPTRKQSQKYYIEKVISHKVKHNKMQFKVNWFGCGRDEDTWEPYHNLKDTEQLHVYLRAHRMESMIPSKYKDMQYVVQNIIGHDENTTEPEKMTFLVKWKNYGHSCNSWEPYTSLKHIQKLHVYLRKHKLKH